MPLGGLTVPSIFVQAAGGSFATRKLLGVYEESSADPTANPAVVKRVEDVIRVVAAASEVWGETMVAVWLRSRNDFLGGARPIDVLLLDGPDEVLTALEATAAGAFS
jgi:uncharacterized protein (DUF2384 family)